MYLNLFNFFLKKLAKQSIDDSDNLIFLMEDCMSVLEKNKVKINEIKDFLVKIKSCFSDDEKNE